MTKKSTLDSTVVCNKKFFFLSPSFEIYTFTRLHSVFFRTVPVPLPSCLSVLSFVFS